MTALRHAVDGLEHAIVRTEIAIDTATDARLACASITFGTANQLGAAQRRAAIEVASAMFGMERAVVKLDGTRKYQPRPDERDGVARCLSRVQALQLRMAEAMGRAALFK